MERGRLYSMIVFFLLLHTSASYLRHHIFASNSVCHCLSKVSPFRTSSCPWMERANPFAAVAYESKVIIELQSDITLHGKATRTVPAYSTGKIWAASMPTDSPVIRQLFPSRALTCLGKTDDLFPDEREDARLMVNWGLNGLPGSSEAELRKSDVESLVSLRSYWGLLGGAAGGE
ncbi:uncharacterized protein EV422DRAFT_540850 [Fimicolochytrium jonesii]|uniref:uncharacterized protein n=1 Tax=Fimicolochytrium jonesii TaxID=1396493 RepID=UPI0022FE9456|nr:uncharacterized protein EV422DRAFT_540850 [Fimicolochytrium jonesii]KAI8817493.1 hypothetical protein EV422DRAFT_540850 [Fimicolochytrium jonesii]